MLRGSGPSVGLVLTAGNLIGAAPASLTPSQRLLLHGQTRRGLAAALKFAHDGKARLVIIAGGLLAAAEPALDDLRFVTRWMQRLQDAGIAVVALDDLNAERHGVAATGLSLLADLGLVYTLRADASDAPLVLDTGGLRMTFVSDPGQLAAFDRRELSGPVVLVAGDASVASADELGEMFVDLAVLGDTRAPSQEQRGSTLVVRPGWTSPAPDGNGPAAGFIWLDLDDRGLGGGEFVPIPDAMPARLQVKADALDPADPAAALRRLLQPLIGDAPMVALEFQGRFSRDIWHRCRLAELVNGAADARTLLSVDLTGLSLRGEDSADAGRPSFLVEVRRAAERLRREAGEKDAGLVQEARAAVSVALGRREPLEPVP